MASDDRGKALDLAFTQIEKQFGKGSIMKLGQADTLKGISVISTGSISLDSALGVGGVPRSRIVEIYGPEASGKTSLTLHIIAEAQKAGGVAAFAAYPAGAIFGIDLAFGAFGAHVGRAGAHVGSNARGRVWDLSGIYHMRSNGRPCGPSWAPMWQWLALMWAQM